MGSPKAILFPKKIREEFRDKLLFNNARLGQKTHNYDKDALPSLLYFRFKCPLLARVNHKFLLKMAQECLFSKFSQIVTANSLTMHDRKMVNGQRIFSF